MMSRLGETTAEIVSRPAAWISTRTQHRKAYCRIFTVLAMMATGYAVAFAQPEPCRPDPACTESPWSATATKDYYVNCGGSPLCTLRIYYKQRTALCSGTEYCDFYVSRVEFIGDCVGCNENVLIGHAILSLIEDPTVNGCLPTIGCNDIVRVFVGACWARVEGEPGQPVALIWYACDDIECCHARYRVCKFHDQYFAQQTTPPWFTGNCGKFVSPPCEPFCERMPQGGPPPETKRVNRTKAVGEERVMVQPNPSQTAVTVSLVNMMAEVIGPIAVATATGAAVPISPTTEIHGKIRSWTIDVSVIPPGTYVFKIPRADGTATTGQFVVAR